MKTFMKICLICGIVFTVAGCKKEKYGDLIIKMTDAPGDYLQVNVDIRQVEVHYASGHNWVTLHTQSGMYDLLTLQHNVTALLATGAHIPAGDVSQIRLILGGNNTVMLNDSTIHQLKIPSAEQSGVKINVHAIVPPGDPLIITLDFDADKSVNKEGNGDYIMKPVITVKEIH
jgi:hypothetical protein